MAYMQRINGTIYHDGWFGYQLESCLRNHKEEDVRLVITSPGGEVGEAIRLSDLVKAHGRVTIEFSGLAASAATWLGFAAQKLVMHNDTLWLCHRTSVGVFEWDNMNAEQLDAFIKEKQSQKKSLEVLDAIIAQKYLDRCSKKGKNLKDIVDLMKEERYLAPSDCLEWGFVDEIIEEPAQEEDVNAIVNAFKLPEIPRGFGQKAQDPAETFSLSNVVEAVFMKMKNLFVAKKDETNNNITMKKLVNFAAINLLLAVDGIEQNDENKSVVLNEDQLKLINEKLEKAGNIEKELNEVLEVLDAISPSVKAIEGAKNKVNAIKAVIDQMGKSVPQPQKPLSKGKEENVVEDGDPINEVAQEIINKRKNKSE